MIKIILVAVLSCVVGALAAIVMLKPPNQAASGSSPSKVAEVEKVVVEPNSPPPAEAINVRNKCSQDQDCAPEKCIATKCNIAGTKTKNDVGGTCFVDGDCKSGECSFLKKCAPRVKPKKENGAKCAFDGDCKSEECKKFRCVINENKSGYK
jgi:hypothetical protein